ncbi:MAG: S-adenosylmethionine:tRNA ribosyltransferase-isomerase, partial [Acidobacteria bacterium]|nr:S-adenosylmethionine:tRNA ribosyltransferase-isomerase [Acidobacteriota bacterium]
MKTKDFWYCLPQYLIAQKPRVPRDSSKLLVLDEENKIIHSKFTRLKDFLKNGDLIVINDSKTIRARIYGNRKSGGKCEILLLRKISSCQSEIWEALCKPAKKLKEGEEILVGNYIIKIIKEYEEGIREVEFFNCLAEDVIRKYGRVPLPPYIKREDTKEDRKNYQTIYAREGNSVAAPTAGLHFTKRVLKSLSEKGVDVARIRLDVGLG